MRQHDLVCSPELITAKEQSAGRLWVPRTSSTSRDQAVFADHATDASVPSDAVLIKFDRFG